MTYFPFDDHACYIHIDSWTYDSTQIRLLKYSEKMPLDEYNTNGQWELLDTEVLTFKAKSVGLYYDEMAFIFHLRRQPMYYILNLLVPIVLLSFLLVLVFLLPADSPKVSFVVTLLLTFSVFQLLIADSMPKSSAAVPLIGSVNITQYY